MKLTRLAAALIGLVALGVAPAWASGDVKEGAELFKKRCFTCHDAQKGAKHKTGPNLFGVFGKKSGVVEGYKFSKSYVEAGEKGLVWNEKALTEYMLDPLAYIRQASGDPRGQSKMTFKLTKKEEAEDIIAYLKAQQ